MMYRPIPWFLPVYMLMPLFAISTACGEPTTKTPDTQPDEDSDPDSDPDSGPDTSPLGALSVADAAGVEGAGTLTVQISLNEAAEEEVAVDYTTTADSALGEADFVSVSGTLTFAPGTLEQDVIIEILDDTTYEEEEQFVVELRDPMNATLGDARGIVTITDDDPAVGLTGRPENLTCLAPPRPVQDTAVNVEDAFPSAPGFSQITKILQVPGDGSRWYVLEKGGRVRAFDTSDPSDVWTFLDFSDQVWTNSEGGLLGMAFTPDFPTTPEVYVNYTGFDDSQRV
ncbi:MAG: Calx-beta domain-containing protein, partial [Myxococcota bacterium]